MSMFDTTDVYPWLSPEQVATRENLLPTEPFHADLMRANSRREERGRTTGRPIARR